MLKKTSVCGLSPRLFRIPESGQRGLLEDQEGYQKPPNSTPDSRKLPRKDCSCTVVIILNALPLTFSTIISVLSLVSRTSVLYLRIHPLSLYREMQDILLFSKIIQGKYKVLWREASTNSSNKRSSKKNRLYFKKFDYPPINETSGIELVSYLNELAAK